jgi:hypothetical protein
MPLIGIITNQTGPHTSAAYTMTGPTEFRAQGLEDGQSVVMQWEQCDGTFSNVKPPVVLTFEDPSILYAGYSDIKWVIQSTTTNQISVGAASAS